MSVCAKCTICPDVCVCVRRGRQFAQSFCWRHSVEQSLSLHKASRKWSPQHTPAQRHPINPFFPPVWCGEACSESQNWSWACEVIYRAEWILTDEILCCLLKWHFVILPGMKRLLTHNTKTFFFYIASCVSPDSSKSWPFNYDWLIWDILTLEN